LSQLVFQNVADRSLQNRPPSAYKSETGVTSKTGITSFSVKRDANKLRVLMAVTTAGTAGTGTTKVLELFKKLKITKVGDSKPTLDVSEQCLHLVRYFGLCKTNLSTLGGMLSTNETMAGDSTYYAAYDIPISMKRGTYNVEYEFIAAASLAGYSTAPSTLDKSFAFWPIDGQPVIKQSHIVAQKAYSMTDYKTTTPAKGVLIYGADALSGYLSGLDFDGELGSQSITFLKAEAQLRTGLSSITVLYLENERPATLFTRITTASDVTAILELE